MYLFQDIKAAAKGMDFKSAREAREWYRKEALKVTDVDRTKVMYTAEPFKIFQNIGGASYIGKMYMFVYDAKYKDILPYFDKFPLIFPIEFYSNGFLGINLHYLPPMARARLMDALYTIANNQKFNVSTRLNISYQILKAYSRQFVRVEECIKRYRYDCVRSAFHYVNPTDWDKALMLPMQQWHLNPNRKYAKALPY